MLALDNVRTSYGAANIDESTLRETIAAEENRVADAAILAELIASRLSLATHQPPAQPQPAPKAVANTLPIPTSIPFPSGNSSSPLSIADFIDGMLSQEKRDIGQPTHH